MWKLKQKIKKEIVMQDLHKIFSPSFWSALMALSDVQEESLVI